MEEHWGCKCCPHGRSTKDQENGRMGASEFYFRALKSSCPHKYLYQAAL